VECVTPGPGLARDFGSKYCEGEFTIFWDSDDIGYPKEVDEILRQGTEFDLLITAFDSEPTIETRPQNNDIQREEALFKFLLKPGLWRCIIRSSIIKEISFGKSKMGEDQVFLARLLSKNPNIKFHSKVTYKYFRDLPDQLTSQRKSLQELGTSISEVATLLREKPIKSESLLATIYIKLCMSGIKRGNFKIKLDNLLKLLSFLFSTDYAFLPSRLRCGLVVKILRGDAHA
jgi:glycosyltransferase involved in cell wall biosynthesis